MSLPKIVSIVDAISLHENITVKFQISDTQIIAHVYANRLTINEIKKDIGTKFKIDPKYLIVTQNNSQISDDTKLIEICKNKFGIVEVKLCLNSDAEKDNVILDVGIYYSHYTLPDIITVQVPLDNDGHRTKEIVVEIENKSIVKPFLGGYKDTRKNIVYHEAFSQTGPAFESIKYDNILSRDTQTTQNKNASDDTFYHQSTQAFGTATDICYISDIADYNIEPKSKYESHEEMVQRIRKIEKVKIIQRNFRAYMVRKVIREMAAEWRRWDAERRRRDSMLEEINLSRYKKECVIKTFPKTKEDFDLLYEQVQRWKEAQVKKIIELQSGGARIAALNCLLDNEIQLLNGIEKQKCLLRTKLKDLREEKILIEIGKPIKWVGYKNMLLEMDTLRTQRIRFLTEYYKKLKKNYDKERRILLLNEISELLMKEENNFVQHAELEELFMREKNLLSFNMNAKELEPLRKRELVLFLDIIKDDENYEHKKSFTRMCEKCKVVRKLEEFALHTRQNVVNICKPCTYLKLPPIDKSIYRGILRTVRRDERKRKALASYAFVIQEDDMRHIVENIWHGHSILSKFSVRTDLRLARFNIGDDWAPWNCICLTEKEARAHVKIKNLDQVYEEKLLLDIQNKNMLAKAAFKKLREIDHDFVESGEWWDVGLDGKTV